MGLHDITIRIAGKQKTVENYTRSKAIKAFCNDCMGGVTAEVRNCTTPLCPLYAFRPYSKPAETAPGEAISAPKIDDLNRTHVPVWGSKADYSLIIGIDHGCPEVPIQS